MATGSARRAALGALRFINVEAASGIVLLVAAALALMWANSPVAPSYAALWHLELGFGLGRYLPEHDLHFWVNDGLMTVFFLVVGLEIRREMHDGSLSNARAAILPVAAAAGGVVVPALLYILINTDPVTHRGWAIPTATDIAFAVGILSLCGRVPPTLRMLLLTLAIIDDIAAILVIALVYSGGIAYVGLLLVGAGVLLILAMQWLGIRPALAYALPGALAWYGMLRAGMHPTLAGVILGLLTPVRASFARLRPDCVDPTALSPVQQLERRLHPWVAFAIMPLFALANAGVTLSGLNLSAGQPLSVAAGIIAGLVFGKPAGIVLAAWLAVKLKLCALPKGVPWRHVLLLGLLGGIGFTMSIFIANLAFEDPQLLSAAKFAVLLGSGLAAVLGLLLGRLRPRRTPA